MEQIPTSGYLYANKFFRVALNAYEEVMGKNGLNAILNLAGLGNLIDNFPPDDLVRKFDFADFTALHVGLEQMYGPRGGRGLALLAGRATFNKGLRTYGALAGFGDPAFKELPLESRIRISLPSAARIFSQATDQLSSVDETNDNYIWTIHRCPVCWSRKGVDKPVCHITTGLLQAMLAWVSGGLKFRVNETRCCAMGDTICEFVIQKEPIS
jgi:hypothetical protein